VARKGIEEVRDMKIAMFGYAHPFGENSIYGAERMIYYLACEFREKGHEVTIFTIRGCELPGFEYIEVPIPWRDDKDIYLDAIKGYEMEKNVKFDHIHSYQASGKISPELWTNWNYSIEPFFSLPQIKHNKVVYSKCLHRVQNSGTVIYYGVPTWKYPEWMEDHNGYLVWVGRMDHGKAPFNAIDVAEKAGERIILMGPSYHYPMCQDDIFDRIDGDRVIWLRGCDDEIKYKVMRKAKAFINPIWNQYGEMFGIVNIEAMACGVPVIGWGNEGSPSAINLGDGEIIKNGVHGYIIRHNGYSEDERQKCIEASVWGVKHLGDISRKACRDLYESKFTSLIMAEKRLRFFELIKERGTVGDVTEELNGV